MASPWSRENILTCSMIFLMRSMSLNSESVLRLVYSSVISPDCSLISMLSIPMAMLPRGWLISWAMPAASSPSDSNLDFWISISCCFRIFSSSSCTRCSRLRFSFLSSSAVFFLSVISETKVKTAVSPSQVITVDLISNHLSFFFLLMNLMS